MELGIVGLLLDTQIGDAVDMTKFAKHLVGDPLVRDDVRTVDLDVNRRGLTEVKDLGHNVGRKKIERRTGKLAREIAAQGAHIVCDRVMFLFQRDKHIDIGRPCQSRVVVHVVDVAARKANIVENTVDFTHRNYMSDTGFDQIR
jgi:hypothetical protein